MARIQLKEWEEVSDFFLSKENMVLSKLLTKMKVSNKIKYNLGRFLPTLYEKTKSLVRNIKIRLNLFSFSSDRKIFQYAKCQNTKIYIFYSFTYIQKFSMPLLYLGESDDVDDANPL